MSKLKHVLLLISWVASFGMGGNAFNYTTAFSLCQSDAACTKFFSLEEGGSFAAFSRLIQVTGEPDGPEEMVVEFENSTDADKGNTLTLLALLRISSALPACPYGNALYQNPVTGASECKCKAGTTCGPPCTAGQRWMIAALSINLAAVFITLANQIVAWTRGRKVVKKP